MDEDTPLQGTPEDSIPIRTQADLYELWRALVGELGFYWPALWMLLVTHDDHATGMITQIEELPPRPDELMLDNLMAICDQLLEQNSPGGRVAFLYARPGSRFVTEADRAWGRRLHAAATRAAVPCEPVHLANDEDLRVLAADDLGLTAPAAETR